MNDKMLGGKIYDDASGKMKFEGELFCDVRNKIKGKEYIDGNLSYEGEYLNGKKWNGEGYKKGNIIYELINGNGNIREYNEDGKSPPEGEHLN